MSEAESVQPAPADADATPGALLKQARERAQLSVLQVAEELHLDTWIVEAIEENRFSVLGAPVFARGHLRKYATQLGLSPDDILARYEALQDRPVEPEPVPIALADSVRGPRGSAKKAVWTIVVLAVVGVLGYLVFDAFFKPGTPPTPVASAPITPAPVETEASSEPAALEANESVVAAPQAPAEQPTAELPSPQTDTATVELPVPSGTASTQPATASPPVELRLEFTGESWTEIYDSAGRRLMFGIGTPETPRTVSGIAPIQVILGAVSAVKLQVNGQTVAIPRREGREAVRFTIEADGTLR